MRNLPRITCAMAPSANAALIWDEWPTLPLTDGSTITPASVLLSAEASFKKWQWLACDDRVERRALLYAGGANVAAA
ncbi:MAG TPA: hypothetical protein VGG99_22485 [Acetobacteraceae bacterium]